MSIFAIVGIPGGGKSYLAAELIFDAINQNRHVVTDMPLSEFMSQHDFVHSFDSNLITSFEYNEFNDDKIDKDFNIKLDSLYPRGALFVLDECWKYMQGGSRIDAIPKQQLFFFKKHRHRANDNGLSDDIVLVTQDLGDISATVRSMVEQTILCVKPVEIGLKNFSVRHYMTTAVKGVKPVDKLIVKTDTIKLKPEIFKLYKSHTQSDNLSNSFNEGSAVKSTFFGSFKFKLMIFGLIVSFVFIAVALTHLNKSKDKYINPTVQSFSKSPVNPSLVNSSLSNRLVLTKIIFHNIPKFI